MLGPDFHSRFIDKNPTGLHLLLGQSRPLGHWAAVLFVEENNLVVFAAHEAASDDVRLPLEHVEAIVAELAKPRRDDELALFVVEAGRLEATRLDGAQIARELGPPYEVDARNHLPAPLPAGWRGPYMQPGFENGFRVDTPECLVLARVKQDWEPSDLDEQGNPRAVWRFEIGVTQAFDAAMASDAQIAAITSHMRHCGPWEERTHLETRRHPSRRVFGARIKGQRGLAWAEVLPFPEMLGPPPGWEPVGSFRDRPLVFRIEGTKLRVAWTPPAGVDRMVAARGEAREPSRLSIRREGNRAPDDEEIGIVFAMLGALAFSEVKRPRAVAKQTRERVFTTTAGWLRPRFASHS